MKISACMITKNEEENLERCINSYKDIVSEVIVVDTGSIDNTVKIAQKSGAKVYFFKWIDDFAAARNFALSKARYDWIIFLDADEYFEKETAKNIPFILQSINNNLNIDCINSTIINIDKVTKRIQDRSVVVRIFRNKKYLKYKSKIHERLMKNIKEYPISLGGYEDKIIIRHTGYSANIIKSKLKRNYKMLLSELNKTKSKEKIYFYLVNTYGGFNDYDNAIKYAKLYIKSGKKIRGYITFIPYLLIKYMIKKGESYETLMEEINKYMKEYPNTQAFTCYAGAVNYSNKRYEPALHYFKKTIFLRKNYKDNEYYEEYITNDNIFYYMSQIYYLKNDISKAMEFSVKSLIEDKLNDNSLMQLLILAKTQQPAEIIDLLNTIYDINNFDDIKYLISKLSSIKYGEVLLYYYNIWSNVFKQQDASAISTFLGMGKFDQAFELLFRCFNEEKNDWDERLLVASALLSDDIENTNKIKDIVSDTYKKIIYCYCDNDNDISFDKNEVNDFINLVSEFILIADSNEKLEKLINIKYKFKFNISNLIGDMLVKWNVIDWGFEEYEDYLKYEDNNYKADVYFKAGVCSYKMDNYGDSLVFFENALKYDYTCADLFEFVSWIIINAKDKLIIKNAKDILNRK